MLFCATQEASRLDIVRGYETNRYGHILIVVEEFWYDPKFLRHIYALKSVGHVQLVILPRQNLYLLR